MFADRFALPRHFHCGKLPISFNKPEIFNDFHRHVVCYNPSDKLTKRPIFSQIKTLVKRAGNALLNSEEGGYILLGIDSSFAGPTIVCGLSLPDKTALVQIKTVICDVFASFEPSLHLNDGYFELLYVPVRSTSHFDKLYVVAVAVRPEQPIVADGGFLIPSPVLTHSTKQNFPYRPHSVCSKQTCREEVYIHCSKNGLILGPFNEKEAMAIFEKRTLDRYEPEPDAVPTDLSNSKLPLLSTYETFMLGIRRIFSVFMFKIAAS